MGDTMVIKRYESQSIVLLHRHIENSESMPTKIIPIPKDARRFRVGPKPAGGTNKQYGIKRLEDEPITGASVDLHPGKLFVRIPQTPEEDCAFEAVFRAMVDAHKQRLRDIGYTDENDRVIRPEMALLPDEKRHVENTAQNRKKDA